VDASHENQLARFPPTWIRLREERYESYSWRGRFSIIGLTRLKVGPNTSLPPEWQDVARALNARTPRYRTLCQEFEGFEQSAVQVRDAHRRLQIPSIVLTAGEESRHPEMTEQDCDYYNKVWKEMQSDLSTRLPGSRHVLVNDSGHSIQLDQPEAVVSAVLEILKEVRGRGGSSLEEPSESGATNQIQ
jgi:pimeloyl-ACP methyl ester carboxylesterase